MSTATPTAARPKPQFSPHWYTPEGTPVHEVPKADKKGMRSTTLADARKLLLYPSVTTVLKVLHKEGLVNWMIEQACLAVLTAPRQEKEELDAFVKRVLHVEEQQQEERNVAADKGTAIHEAMQLLFKGQPVPSAIEPWVMPVFEGLAAYGKVVGTEIILVGDGYAGTTDLLLENEEYWMLADYKGTKNIPDRKKGPWPEHRLQLSAYARALKRKLDKALTPDGKSKPIICANIYISTANLGEYSVIQHEDWESTYELGFAPLVRHWQWSTGYFPPMLTQPEPAKPESEPPTEEVPAAIPVMPAPAPTNGPQEHKSGKKVVWTPGVPTPVK